MSVDVTIRAVVRGEIKSFDQTLDNQDKDTVEAAVDLFEGQVGTVLSVKTVGGTYLFISMIDDHEAGAR